MARFPRRVRPFFGPPMVQFNTRGNEILLKLVYYGPGLSGKTTNLQALHAMCSEAHRGEMFSVNTQEDRTLFFDLLPIKLGFVYGNAIHLQIYTVPGQVQYDASRRVVLGGADGVAFVADSSEAKMQENVDSLSNLYHNLNANRLNIKQIPFVLQYNKRDLADAMPVGVLNRRLNFRGVPYVEAVANQGVGVLDTFLALTRETVAHTFRKYHLDKKIQDFEDMLNLVETQVRANLQEPAGPSAPTPVVAPEATVLRHSPMSTEALAAGKPADAQELLEDALKSNMETASLYTELKHLKDALEKKHQELGRACAELDRANQDNLRTRRYLEGLMQNIGEAVVSYAPDGRILTWNLAAERMFGYARGEIVGRNINQLTPDALLGELHQATQRVIQGQVVRDLVTTRLRRGAEAFPVSITFAPVRGNDDRVLACSALVRELAEPTLDWRAELRTPLLQSLVAALDQRLEPLGAEARRLTEASADPRQADQAARLRDAVDALRALVEPLRTLVAPPQAQPRRVSLNRLLREAAARVDPEAQEGGVPLSLDLDPALPEVELDPRLTLQALTGLLRSGLRGTERHRGTPLRITTRSGPQGLQVEVRAAGPPLEATPDLAAMDLPAAEALIRQQGGRLQQRRLPEGLNLWVVELPFAASPVQTAGWGLGATS